MAGYFVSYFPKIRWTHTAEQSTNAGSGSSTYPSTTVAGDLLLVLYKSTYPSVPSGWEEVSLYTTAGPTLIYASIATGTWSTFSFANSTSSPYVAQTYCIYDWNGTIADDVKVAWANSDDPPSLNPGWGTDDILWLTGVAARRSDWESGNSLPANYTDMLTRFNTSSDDVSKQGIVSGRRSLIAASEDPGALTINSNRNDPHAFTIAIRPVPPVTIKRYNGTTWENGVLKRYNGNAWEGVRTLKRWNGSTWVEV